MQMLVRLFVDPMVHGPLVGQDFVLDHWSLEAHPDNIVESSRWDARSWPLDFKIIAGQLMALRKPARGDERAPREPSGIFLGRSYRLDSAAQQHSRPLESSHGVPEIVLIHGVIVIVSGKALVVRKVFLDDASPERIRQREGEHVRIGGDMI